MPKPILRRNGRKLILAISAIGPGLFLIGYNIGTGSVTTMAMAGARYGMNLLWALVLSCIFTYVLMVAYGRVTLVSGNTALFNIKHKIRGGKWIALYILVALVLGELFALIGIMGIMADLTRMGIALITNGLQIKNVWIIIVFTILMYILLWHGKYNTFEKLLTVLVIIMGLCFIVVFFMIKPSFVTIIEGIVPGVPGSPDAFAIVAGMAGTTCSAAVFIMRSTVVAEKGWDIKNLRNEKRDSFVAAFMMFFLSGIIMAVSAGTLYVMGLPLNNTSDLISLFKPIGGEVAALLLILGVLGAGLSTVFPIVMIAPWLISDFTGKQRDFKSPLYRILMALGLLFAFGSVFLKQTAPLLMVFSQAFQACILPAVVIPVFILINRRNFMGKHSATFGMNIGLVAVTIFALLTTYFAIIGFFN